MDGLRRLHVTGGWAPGEGRRFAAEMVRRQVPQRWLAWVSWVGALVGIFVLLGLFAVIPIDIVVQSKTNNTHLTSNTLVIFCFLAFTVLSVLLFQVNRIRTHKRNINAIPSRWIPISAADVGLATATYVTPLRHPRASAGP